MEGHTPFPRSYWVVPGRLLAGYYPGAADEAAARQKLAALLDCGIRVVLNLMEPGETDWCGQPFSPYTPLLDALAAERGVEVQCLRLPIRDAGVPSPEEMRAILDAIDTTLAADLPVYVHCWGGKGRTGTVIGCYLARHGIAVGDAALREIQRLRRHEARASERSPETEEQRRFVREWPAGA